MNEERIREMIGILQEKNPGEDAYLAFYENCIKANRSGLERYALELLKASMEAGGNTHTERLRIDADWISRDTDYLFPYIEFDNPTEPVPEDDSLKDTISKVSYIVICITGLTIFGIGFMTIINWCCSNA